MNTRDTESNFSASVLVVDDDQAIRDCLTEALDLLGFIVCSAQDGEEALKIFRESDPVMVITDIRMPKVDGLRLTQDIKRLREDCPVIVVTGYGDEATAIAALKAGACDYLRKPFELAEMKETVHRALSLVRAKGMEMQSLRTIERMSWEFQLENDLVNLSGIIPFMLRPVCAIVSTVEGLHLQMALQELLANAIEHGNLAITAEEKRDAIMADVYEDLLEVRQLDPEFVNRRVRVSIQHDGPEGLFRCKISDEGAGFNWQSFLESSHEMPSAMVGSGRGIFLVKTLMPEIQYHGRGNEVTLVVRYKPTETLDATSKIAQQA